MENTNEGPGSRKRFLTVPEAAEQFRCHPETVRRWCRENRVPHVKLRGRHLIDADALDRIIEAQLAENGAGS